MQGLREAALATKKLMKINAAEFSIKPDGVCLCGGKRWSLLISLMDVCCLPSSSQADLLLHFPLGASPFTSTLKALHPDSVLSSPIQASLEAEATASLLQACNQETSKVQRIQFKVNSRELLARAYVDFIYTYIHSK